MIPNRHPTAAARPSPFRAATLGRLVIGSAILSLSWAGGAAPRPRPPGAACAAAPIWGMVGPDRRTVPIANRLVLYRQFRLGWVRVNTDLPPTPAQGLTSLDDIGDFHSAGLRVLLTVADPALEHDGAPPQAYQDFAAALRATLLQYRPAMIAVENEADGASDTASAGAYLGELKIGCAVAHAAGVLCADSGMTSKMMIALLVHEYLLHGDAAKADHYAHFLRLWYPMHFQADPTGPDLEALLQRAGVRRARAILADLRRAGADRANLHWYVRPSGAATPQDQADLLRQIVQMMRTVSGLPVAAGEVGLDKPRGDDRTVDPVPFVAMMNQLADLGVAPVIVWNPGTGRFPANANSRSLVDAAGNLLPVGSALVALTAARPAVAAPHGPSCA